MQKTLLSNVNVVFVKSPVIVEPGVKQKAGC